VRENQTLIIRYLADIESPIPATIERSEHFMFRVINYPLSDYP